MMLAEMRRIYTGAEISVYVSSDPTEIKKLAFDSFKIANPNIKFEEFEKICTLEDARKSLALINELEENESKKKVAGSQ